MSTGVYSYTLWHFVGFFVCNSVVLCVIHNSVGSALLVLTVMGIPEPRDVERVTVQFLRFFGYWWLFRGLGYYCYCYEKKVLLVAVRCIGVGLGFL